LELVGSLCYSLLRTLWSPFVERDLSSIERMGLQVLWLVRQRDGSLWGLLERLELLRCDYFLSWFLTWFTRPMATAEDKARWVLQLLCTQGREDLIYISAALLLRESGNLKAYAKEQGLESPLFWWFPFRRQGDPFAQDMLKGLMYRRLALLPGLMSSGTPDGIPTILSEAAVLRHEYNTQMMQLTLKALAVTSKSDVPQAASVSATACKVMVLLLAIAVPLLVKYRKNTFGPPHG